MAALTMTPPTRQPFASLDTPRMRSVMRPNWSRQNQQNGMLLFPLFCTGAMSSNH